MTAATHDDLRARILALGVSHNGPECDPIHGIGVVLALRYGGQHATRLERGGLRVTPVGTKHVLVRP